MPTPRRTLLKRLGAAALVSTGAAVAGRTTAASAATASAEDDILLDSFSGTDDQKLTAALDLARNSSPRRPIRLSPRSHTFSQTRTTFSGLRILGPNVGWQNPEIANTSGALPQCNVTLNCGNGAKSWLVGTETTYNVMVAGITFKSSNAVTQFYHHPYSAGTSYATTLDTLSFYGFKHVLGTPADPFSMTLVTIKGSWTCVGVQDTQFSLRGSDNFLWVAGDLNYGWQGANQGRYLMRFSNLSKTAVKHLYLTARGGSRADPRRGDRAGWPRLHRLRRRGPERQRPGHGCADRHEGAGVLHQHQAQLRAWLDRRTSPTRRTPATSWCSAGRRCINNVWVNRANQAGSRRRCPSRSPWSTSAVARPT